MQSLGICKYANDGLCTCKAKTNGEILECSGIFEGLDESDLCPYHDDTE